MPSSRPSTTMNRAHPARKVQSPSTMKWPAVCAGTRSPGRNQLKSPSRNALLRLTHTTRFPLRSTDPLYRQKLAAPDLCRISERSLSPASSTLRQDTLAETTDDVAAPPGTAPRTVICSSAMRDRPGDIGHPSDTSRVSYLNKAISDPRLSLVTLSSEALLPTPRPPVDRRLSAYHKQAYPGVPHLSDTLDIHPRATPGSILFGLRRLLA